MNAQGGHLKVGPKHHKLCQPLFQNMPNSITHIPGFQDNICQLSVTSALLGEEDDKLYRVC